jgi:hypothetical protein
VREKVKKGRGREEGRKQLRLAGDGAIGIDKKKVDRGEGGWGRAANELLECKTGRARPTKIKRKE